MKICIVGGGSAGWMTATTLRLLDNVDITLVESPDIKVLGVGESTLGQIQQWIDAVGIRESEEDFVRETGGTLKHSIKFTNWLTKDSGSYQYPFQPKGDKYFTTKKWWGVKNTGWDLTNYGQDANPLGMIAEAGKFDINDNYAYHFDSIKFGQFLRKRYCQKVNHITANVEGFVWGVGSRVEREISAVKLDNGEKIEADLFIDCTGFASKILGEWLKEPYIPYEQLPNDSAWATRIPYKDKESEMVAYTECTAIDNGWVWTIPLWDHKGTGYVYSSKHISKEDAKKEFMDHLGIEDGEFKHISMKIGRYERTWVGNTVAIGLSSGFIEPLESNALLTVHKNVLDLYKILKRSDSQPSSMVKQLYNIGTAKFVDEFADFIDIHYGLTTRRDTPYWRDQCLKEYVLKDDIYGIKSYANEMFDLEDFIFPEVGWPYIASGMGLSPYVHQASWEERNQMVSILKEWEAYVDKLPSMYQFLKSTVYAKA